MTEILFCFISSVCFLTTVEKKNPENDLCLRSNQVKKTKPKNFLPRVVYPPIT